MVAPAVVVVPPVSQIRKRDARAVAKVGERPLAVETGGVELFTLDLDLDVVSVAAVCAQGYR